MTNITIGVILGILVSIPILIVLSSIWGLLTEYSPRWVLNVISWLILAVFVYRLAGLVYRRCVPEETDHNAERCTAHLGGVGPVDSAGAGRAGAASPRATPPCRHGQGGPALARAAGCGREGVGCAVRGMRGRWL